MDLNHRLQKAIQRGNLAKEQSQAEAARRALSAEEIKRLFSQQRLDLTDRIETNLRELTSHLPGFQFENVVGDAGWGGAVSRDDFSLNSGRRGSAFSRLELVVRPLNQFNVLDLAAKGAIRNKEVFTRTHYQKLVEADMESFENLIDMWVVEYAELYTKQS